MIPRYRTFFAELKRRHVFKVAAVYGATAFVVLQVADIIFPSLGVPAWAIPLIVALTLVGFPLALVLAWAFEMTPAGVRREDPATSVELNAIVAQPRRQRWPAGVLALLGIVLLVAGAWWVGRESRGAGVEAMAPEVAAAGSQEDQRPSVAVLPFANLSGDAETQPFTDGIHDDVLTQLTKIGSLKVISRTSVLEYRETTKKVGEIADELGVATVLEGGVQRAGDQVRINVQLIDAGTDEHLWAERYNRDLTAANIFAIQTEIAEAIAGALQARLTPEERESLAERPTESLEAYENYRRALSFLFTAGYQESLFRTAESLLSRAIAADSSFAEAYAHLSIARSNLYWFHYDRSPEIRAAALAAAERALELDPDLPEAHHALGEFYYRFDLDYERAMAELSLAERARPGSGEIQEVAGAVLRRKGDFEGAVERFRRAVELNPRSPLAQYSLGETLSLMRRFDEAAPIIERVVELAPEQPTAYVFRASNAVLSSGDLAAARRYLDAGRNLGVVPARDWMYFEIAHYERDVPAMRRQLELAEDPLDDSQFQYVPKALGQAWLNELGGDEQVAGAYYDSARVQLEARVADDPEDPRYHSALGLALAGLDRTADAVREGERAVEIMPPEREAWRGTSRVHDLAKIYAAVGRHDDAVDLLQGLLRRPAPITEHLLRIDPAWDPLRSHPRFVALVGR
ncbi:MAG: tetratricopeptide repeat protein [Gemmatimonadota bacterium]|nr:MAG: tetratricopeptide repeat protein [Gemmatimonadota bacterium]